MPLSSDRLFENDSLRAGFLAHPPIEDPTLNAVAEMPFFTRGAPLYDDDHAARSPLAGVVERQRRAQAHVEQDETMRKIAEDLDRSQVLRTNARAQRIWAAVPEVDPATVTSLATADLDIEDAIRQARVSSETRNSGGFWNFLGDAAGGVGKGLKAAFLDAPEWLWRKTVVDAMQEVAELSGAPSEIAQTLSPGNVAVALLPGDWGAQRDGEWLPLEEWSDGAKWASGGLDLIARLTADPTVLMGRFRALRALPFKAERLLSISRGTRTARLGSLAAREGADVAEIAIRELANAKGIDAVKAFIVGDLHAHELVRGNTVRRALDDITDLSKGATDQGLYTAAAKVASRYGGRFGQDPKIAYALALGAARGGRDGAEEMLVSVLTGRVHPNVQKEIGRLVDAHRAVTSTKNEALRIAEELRGSWVTVVEDQERQFGFGEHFFGEPSLSPTRPSAAEGAGLSKLTSQSELRYLEEHTFPSGVLPDPGIAERTLARADRMPREVAGAAQREQRVLEQQLKPFAAVAPGVDTYLEHGVLDAVRATTATEGFSLPSVTLGQDIAAWSERTGMDLRKVPGMRGIVRSIGRGVQMEPWSQVPVHDPMRFEQYRRLAAAFGLDENRQAYYAGRAMQDVTGEALGGIRDQLLREGSKQLGLTEELQDRLFRSVASRQQEVYGTTAKGKGVSRRLYASQENNLIALTDPRIVRMMRGRMGRWLLEHESGGIAAFEKSVTEFLEQVNTLMRRVWVARPATGLRVALDEQGRAAAFGLRSMYTHPMTALAVASAPYAPKTAGKMLDAGLPQELRDIIFESGELGLGRSLSKRGLFRGAESEGFAVQRFDKMTSPAMQHEYREAQLRAIKDFFGNDPYTNEWIFNGEEAAIRWLSSPAAHAHRRALDIAEPGEKVGKGRVSIAHHAKQVREDLDNLGLRDPEIREALIAGTLDAEMLAGREAPFIAAGNFQEAAAKLAWSGRASNRMDALIGRFLGEPSYVGRQATIRAELWSSVWQRVQLAESAGVKFRDEEKDWLATLIKGEGVVPRKGSERVRKIVEESRGEVSRVAKKLFYDFNEKSRFMDLARLVFPFGGAYQEMGQVWGRTMLERPWIPHELAQAWGAIDDVPGLSYTEPNTGEKMFVVPLSHWLTKFAGLDKINPITGAPEGIGVPLVGRFSGLNLVTGGGNFLPGIGPFIQMPASFATRNMPQANGVMNILFPFGQAGWYDALTPAWMRRFRQFVSSYTSGADADRIFANQVKDAWAYEAFSALKQGKDIRDVDEDRAIGLARVLFAVRAIASFAAPTGVRAGEPAGEALPVEIGIESAEEDAPTLPLSNLVSYYRFMQRQDPALADRMMLEAYGPEIMVLLEAKTKLVRSGRRPTTEQAGVLLQSESFRGLVEKYGDPAWSVFKEIADGDFDPREYRRQLATGERVPVSIDDWQHAALAQVGWQHWFTTMARMERDMLSRGIPNFQSKRAAPFRLARDLLETRLGQAIPPWAMEHETGTGAKRMQRVNMVRLAALAGREDMGGLETIEATREYFRLREIVGERLAARELRGLNSKKALGLRFFMMGAVRDIVKRYPSFARIYGQFLSGDDVVTSLRDLAIETRALEEVA